MQLFRFSLENTYFPCAIATTFLWLLYLTIVIVASIVVVVIIVVFVIVIIAVVVVAIATITFNRCNKWHRKYNRADTGNIGGLFYCYAHCA